MDPLLEICKAHTHQQKPWGTRNNLKDLNWNLETYDCKFQHTGLCTLISRIDQSVKGLIQIPLRGCFEGAIVIVEEQVHVGEFHVGVVLKTSLLHLNHLNTITTIPSRCEKVPRNCRSKWPAIRERISQTVCHCSQNSLCCLPIFLPIKAALGNFHLFTLVSPTCHLECLSEGLESQISFIRIPPVGSSCVGPAKWCPFKRRITDKTSSVWWQPPRLNMANANRQY